MDNKADKSLSTGRSVLICPGGGYGGLVEVATHGGSQNNLLGTNPSQNDIIKYSAEKQVTKDTPPTLLLLSENDESVQTLNSTNYYNALKQYTIPTTMYIFPIGGHGWGMKPDFEYHSLMLDLLDKWLKKL